MLRGAAKPGLLQLLAALAALVLAGSSRADDRDRLLAPDESCPNPTLSAPAAVQREAMLCFHAYARRQAGVRPVHPTARLFRSAKVKARWIRSCRSFSHTPCGRPLRSVFHAVRYDRGAWAIGENLAWGSGSRGGVRAIFIAWLKSPEQRRNIVRAEWRELGVTRTRSRRLFGYPDVTLWVAHFGWHGAAPQAS
jgi:uncharacterized protein YkwD